MNVEVEEPKPEPPPLAAMSAAKPEREVWFTLQVWQIAAVVLGVLALAAKFLLGVPVPIDAQWSGLAVRGVAFVLVVALLLFVVLRNRKADEVL